MAPTRPASLAFGLAVLAPLGAQGLKGDALREALHDSAADFWIYDDLAAAEARARRTAKPLLISFRCVP